MSILVALDAGHGIHEPRRCLKSLDPSEHREWWLNDRVARYFKERADQYEGFKTLRVDDTTGETDVKLAERCRRANEAKANFFLSFHHNGGINGGKGGGLVAYSYPNSTSGAAYRDKIYDAVLAAGKLRGNRANPKATANYAVLRQTNMPAVLVEHGFMDSSTDVPIILSEAYAKACGYAEADILASIFGLKKKEEKNVYTGDYQHATNTEKEEPLDKPSAWAKEACDWAVEKNIVVGNGNGYFGWKETITKEQLMVILKNLFN